jgi:hypothetical protein
MDTPRPRVPGRLCGLRCPSRWSCSRGKSWSRPPRIRHSSAATSCFRSTVDLPWSSSPAISEPSAGPRNGDRRARSRDWDGGRMVRRRRSWSAGPGGTSVPSSCAAISKRANPFARASSSSKTAATMSIYPGPRRPSSTPRWRSSLPRPASCSTSGACRSRRRRHDSSHHPSRPWLACHRVMGSRAENARAEPATSCWAHRLSHRTECDQLRGAPPGRRR